ncbi:alcohol dehydrogenase [Bifidobacterium choloepi]|uniref:Alcohol dehydrogenase n=1 Tax=Bifidobacterium choloepi TaxID=2614131 RepID=A0A6I5N8C5_9BIFI|nr:alcohol dehydrogenase [Bifidobacterium choloepi]NEG70091.1 alcohol dehydrogenase [Bifidobacterium choloepi]
MTNTTSTESYDRLLPWSHRQPVAVRILIDALAGIGAGVVGTLAHRMGAWQNLPYGLLLAFVLLGCSAWCARSRDGVIGLAVHLITSSGVVWMMAMYGPMGDAMVPIGFSTDTLPFFSQKVGLIWLAGVVVLQIVMLVLPRRWFSIVPAE